MYSIVFYENYSFKMTLIDFYPLVYELMMLDKDLFSFTYKLGFIA